MQLQTAMLQLSYLAYEVRAMNTTPLHWLNCWFRPAFWMITSYRLNRCGYLAFGKGFIALRIIIAPLLFILRPWVSYGEINYRASIGRGFKVMHPTLGVVISALAVIGDNFHIVGGNNVGIRLDRIYEEGSIRIGNNVTMGANAVIIGPVTIGNDVQIGAGSVVVKDVPDKVAVGGVPARILNKNLLGIVDNRHTIGENN